MNGYEQLLAEIAETNRRIDAMLADDGQTNQEFTDEELALIFATEAEIDIAEPEIAALFNV